MEQKNSAFFCSCGTQTWASQTWHFAATSRSFLCKCPGTALQLNIQDVKEGGFYRSTANTEGKNNLYSTDLFLWAQIPGLSILTKISYNYTATRWPADSPGALSSISESVLTFAVVWLDIRQPWWRQVSFAEGKSVYKACVQTSPEPPRPHWMWAN